MAVYDLCPKCGAVSKDGVCSSCGYKIPGIYVEPTKESESVENTEAVEIEERVASEEAKDEKNKEFPEPELVDMPKYYNPGINIPEGNSKNNAGIYAVLVAIGAIVLILVIATVGATWMLAKNIISDIGQNIVSENSNDNGFDIDNWFSYDTPSYSVDDDYIYRYGYYDGHLSDVLENEEKTLDLNDWKKMEASKYDGSDPNAYEFDDYVDGDVKYSVEKGYWEYLNETGVFDKDDQVLPHYLYMQGSYVRLKNTGLKNEDAVNAMIYSRAIEAANIGELAVYYLGSDSDEEIYVSNDVYVAYMDDDIISLLFSATGYYITDWGKDNQNSQDIMAHIYSINIDLKTGEEIKASEAFAFGGKFYETFKARCLEQNGSPVDFYDDDTLIQILTDDAQVVWVYTPLGLEVGVNREAYSGWATGTFTDYSQFYKIY